MRRQALVALVLVAMVLLAGCGEVSEVAVDPTGRVAKTVDDGGDRDYRVELGADVSASKADVVARGVTVHGYATDGTEVCRADVGDVATATFLGIREDGHASATTRCDVVPSVLTVTFDGLGASDDGSLLFPMKLTLGTGVYVGQGNGTSVLGVQLRPGPHRYEDGTARTKRVSSTSPPARANATPDDGLLRYAKCRQYDSDLDLSAVPDPSPWTEGDPDPPTVTEWYDVRLQSKSPLDDEESNYEKRDLDQLSPALREAILDLRQGPEDPADDYVEAVRNLTDEQVVATHDSLTDGSATSVEDVPLGDEDSQNAGADDDRRIDCSAGRYRGDAVEWKTYRIEVDGTYWEVTIRHHTDWSGRIDVPTVDWNESEDR